MFLAFVDGSVRWPSLEMPFVGTPLALGDWYKVSFGAAISGVELHPPLLTQRPHSVLLENEYK